MIGSPHEHRKGTHGFSLIEVLLAIAIFGIIATAIFLSYSNILDVIARTRTRTLASSLINKQIEMVRNLPYDSVGIDGGFPVGVLPATTTILHEGQQFTLNYYVRNIDDPFDGKTGGSPNDTAPADYKLVELRANCVSCFNFVPVTFTTWVAPQNLESSTLNGSLFINVFDASGQAISDVDVLVSNTALSPDITINDTTNNSGSLQLVDIPPSTNGYQVTASKSGYTTSRTYTPGAVENPNPSKPHATVATQQITALSFSIDRVSTINVKTQDMLCRAVPSIAMTQTGQKLIGSGPNVPLYSQAFTTDSAGASPRSNLEWDTYAFINTSTGSDMAGSLAPLPFSIDPNTTRSLEFLMEPKASTGLLVAVLDENGAPLPSATVNLVKIGFDETKITGQKEFTATDWSGGQYALQDGLVTDNAPTGELHITLLGSVYATNTASFVESNTIDFGTATTTFHSFGWNPVIQPASTALRFQLSSANASSGPWTYTGPDGTSNTYYTASSTLSAQYDAKRFFRYKAYLTTTIETATPVLRDVALSFSSGCVPSYQAFWSGIGTGSYTYTITKSGYQPSTGSITVGSGWQELRVTLTP